MPVGEITVSGQINGQPWRQHLQLNGSSNAGASADHAGVASVWARQKIAGLMDQKIAGREEASVRAEVLPLALKHRLLSPYTSFVAVEQVVSRPMGEVADSKAVPNTSPLGQRPQTFAYPRTATTAPAKVWFGVFCLFLAMMIWILRQPEVDHVPSDHE
jgi:Ca-activated chloride channel family protein